MKILVAHSGTQHSMNLAIALKKFGHEVQYVTTVYNRKGSLTNFLIGFLKGDNLLRAKARKKEGLADKEVVQVCEFYGLLMLLLKRLDKKRKLYNIMEHRMRKKFGRKVAKKAKNFDALFMFDTQAKYAFEKLTRMGSSCIKIIDYSAAYAEDSLSLYKEMMLRYPKYKDELFAERRILWEKKKMECFREELRYSDYILTASTFVRDSVLKFAPEKKTFVVPYGASFEIQERSISSNVKLKVVYVGNVTVMKGIPFVFEALSLLKRDDIEVVFVGAVANNIKKLGEEDARCTFVGRVPHEKVKDYLEQADVFLFPSLSDGFGIAPLEAMYYGIPCIISKSAGVSDIVKDGENGFIIPSMDVNAIKEKLEWCLDNRQKLQEMKQCVYQTAKKYTWANYAQGINEMLSQIFKG